MHNSLPNELHWTKYLEANCDRLQRPLLEEVFVRCEDFIDFLSPFLSLKQIKPTLFIVKEDENKAGHKNGKIYIFEGLLKPFKISDENAAIHSGQNVTSVYLFYVIAHEFFHYSRQHNKIKEKFSGKYNKSLEFDADRLSIESLYQFTKNRLLQLNIGLDVKESILISLFYPFRNKMKNEKTDCLRMPRTLFGLYAYTIC